MQDLGLPQNKIIKTKNKKNKKSLKIFVNSFLINFE